MKVNRHLLSFLVLFSLFSCQNSKEDKLLIASASSTRFVMEELVNAFTKDTGIECSIIAASSGKLTAQIMEGAPYHLFLSADLYYPNELHKSGMVKDPPVVYTLGSLVLWSAIDSVEVSIQTLNTNSIKAIATASPLYAPYGKAAAEVMEYYKVSDSLKDKLVIGESISQTNQFILSKTAEIGFTSKSVVLTPEFREIGHWMDLPKECYTEIVHGMVILDENSASARKFYNFVLSEKAQEIFLKNGFQRKEGT